MKATVLQSACIEALAYVSKGTANNASLPIFSGVLLKAHDATLELQTSDMDSSVRYQIPCEVENAGGCVVPASMLLSMIKNCPDAPILFESSDTNLSIACEHLQYSLPSLPMEDFPEFPVIESTRSVELPSQTLAEMVEKVHNVSSMDTSHPILTGVYLRVEDNTLRLVATDSFRLAICETHVDTGNLTEPFEVVVNSKSLHAALSLARKTGNVLVGMSDVQVSFVYGNAAYVCKKLEGNFPNYQQLLPKECSTKADVNKNTLSEALKHVSVVAQSNPSISFSIDIDGKLLTLAGKNVGNESAEDQLDIEGIGKNITIGLNNRYVQDCLSNINSDTVSIELTESVQPAVFKAPGDISYLYLLMPMRI